MLNNPKPMRGHTVPYFTVDDFEYRRSDDMIFPGNDSGTIVVQQLKSRGESSGPFIFNYGVLPGLIKDKIRGSGGRVPSKIKGRKGTRRAWKRSHPPITYQWSTSFQ